MIQINLVPDVKLELIRAQRVRSLVVSACIIGMIASAGVVALLGVVYGGQRWREVQASNEIKKQDKKFRELKDVNQLVTIQNQLQSIQSTHEDKTMSSRIFALLAEASAKGTDNSVSFSSFSVDTANKTISMMVQTDKRGFEAADVFRKNIEAMQMFYIPADDELPPNEFKADPEIKRDDEKSVKVAVSEVDLSNLSYASNDDSSKKTVNFRLTFEYSPTLFDAKVDLLRIRGLGRGNVTDSYKRLPQSLFDVSGANEGEQAQ